MDSFWFDTLMASLWIVILLLVMWWQLRKLGR